MTVQPCTQGLAPGGRRYSHTLLMYGSTSPAPGAKPWVQGWTVMANVTMRSPCYLFLVHGDVRPTGSWFWSSWFRTGYLFRRRFLERGIILRTHESSSFVSSHLKLFKDRLLLKIQFNALTANCCTLCTIERSIKNWPISRTGYQF